MDMNSQTFKLLVEENNAFRRLYEEHLKYEKQLEELDRNHYINPEQEIQRKTIQKLKLNGKDRMSIMVRDAEPG